LGQLRTAWQNIKGECDRLLGKELMRSILSSQDLGPTLDKLETKEAHFWRASETGKDHAKMHRAMQELEEVEKQASAIFRYYDQYISHYVNLKFKTKSQRSTWATISMGFAQAISRTVEKARKWVKQRQWDPESELRQKQRQYDREYRRNHPQPVDPEEERRRRERYNWDRQFRGRP